MKEHVGKKDLKEVLMHLQEVKPFLSMPGRKHKHFSFNKGLLESISITKIIKWINKQCRNKFDHERDY